MRCMACRVGPATLAIALFALVLAVPRAAGDTTDIIEPQFSPPNAKNSGFQAGTCTANFLDPPPPPTEYCSEETPSLFFQQAAGHPPVAFTQYIIQHAPFTPLPSPPFPPGSVAAPIKEPILDRSIKTLQVDIPPGFTVNPEATPRCPLTQFVNVTPEGIIPACNEATAVGLEEVTLVTNAENVNVPGVGVIPTKGFVIPPTPGISKVPVFNLEPKEGEPALFGFVIARQRVIFIEGDVAWESDFHQSFQIRPPEPAIPGLSTLISRLVNYGQDAGNFKVVSGAYVEENGEPKPQPTGSGDGTFLTLPTTCFDPNQFPDLYSTWFRAESYGDPNPTFPAGSTPVEAELPPGERPEGCEKVPFEPSLETGLSTNAVDSPAAATVTVRLPFNPAKEGGEGVSQSHVRSARVTLPEGLGLNPAAVNTGLGSCTDAQFGKGTRNTSNSCPPSSQIGTVAVETPPLPPGALAGNVYLGQQLSRDPASGKEFRIFVEAKSLRYGIVARLIGEVVANPETGQLTTVFDEPPKVTPFAGTLPHGLPQVPFESIRLSLDEAKRLLTSPPTCGPNATTSLMEPWAREGQLVSTPPTSFTLSTAPWGRALSENTRRAPLRPDLLSGSENSESGSLHPV